MAPSKKLADEENTSKKEADQGEEMPVGEPVNQSQNSFLPPIAGA